VPQDVARRARIGLAQLALDSKFADQTQQGLSALKTLRPALKKESLFFDGLDEPAHAAGCLQQRHRHPELLQPVRASKPRNPAPGES